MNVPDIRHAFLGSVNITWIDRILSNINSPIVVPIELSCEALDKMNFFSFFFFYSYIMAFLLPWLT